MKDDWTCAETVDCEQVFGRLMLACWALRSSHIIDLLDASAVRIALSAGWLGEPQ